MKLVTSKTLLIAAVLVGAAAAAWVGLRPATPGASGASVESRTVNWYVVHARDYREYNEQLVSFGKSLGEKTGGALKVEFAYSDVGSGWRDPAAEADGYAAVTSGKYDVSQLGVDTLGAKVITYPYVFRNYDHAEAVWRGPTGKKLLDGIATASAGQLSALTFSYSGGFRALVGSRAIQGADDVKGAKILVDSNGLSPDGELLVELGADPSVINSPEDRIVSDRLGDSMQRLSNLLSAGKLDLFPVEINGLAYAELARPVEYKDLHVNLTDQTMHVTSIVANSKFLASLDPELRAILEEETRKFAIAERQLSARLAIRNLETFSKKYGHKVVALPEAARARFVDAAKAVHAKHGEWSSMIDEIQAAGEIPLLAVAGAAESKVTVQ